MSTISINKRLQYGAVKSQSKIIKWHLMNSKKQKQKKYSVDE